MCLQIIDLNFYFFIFYADEQAIVARGHRVV